MRKDLDKHLNEECVKVLRHCPNSECPEMMGNGKVKEHVEHTCKYTIVSCKHCPFYLQKDFWPGKPHCLLYRHKIDIDK